MFAPNAKLHNRVVPDVDPSNLATVEFPGVPVAPSGDHSPSPELPAATAGDEPLLQRTRTYRVPWADLLKKVFAIDVLACPECGGRLRLIATVAKRILDHVARNSTGPPRVGQPDSVDPAPAYDVADPVYEG